MKTLKVLLVLVTIGFMSCESKSTSDDDLSVSSSVNSEVIVEDIESVLDNVSIYSEASFGIGATSKTVSSSKEAEAINKHGRSGFFKDCADIIVEVANDTITTTITFSGECEDYDGNIITGTIKKIRTISDTSKERTLIIENLTINGYVINGTKTSIYTTNDNGNPALTSTVDISVETDEGTITKVGTRTIEITAGADTDSCYDDENTITGSSTITLANGATFTVEITTPLIQPAGCRYIASGVKQYTNASGTVTVDYGDGTCDNIATKTALDGTVTEIQIGKKRHH